MNKWLLSGIVVAVIIVTIIIIASISVCPADVKVCPDGSYVARSGLGCAFAQCPVAFCVDLGGYTCIDQDYYLAGYYTGDEYGYCSAGTMNALISSPILVCCTEPCQSCAKEGDFVNPEQLKGQTEYLDECCSGLKGMGAYKISDDGECEQLVGTPFLTCTPCGDGVCEDTLFENSCNCPEDCGETIPVCEKDKKFAENVSSNPMCTKEDFICLDGWETIAYYDHRLTDTLQLPEEIYTTTGAPQDVQDATVSTYSTSSCSCEKPVSYSILEEGGLGETNCESFHNFINDYNSSCSGCLLTWITGCC